MNAYSDGLVFQSQLRQSVVIELYTSEGCSSCPPAERFLNKFTRHPELWTTFIPLAFHVDYWDHLGWKDRFSKPQYSERQRTYARLRQQGTIYTPAFLVNGHSWRPDFYNTSIEVDETRVGRLKLVVNDGFIEAQFIPLHANTDTELNIALLGMDIQSHIRSGENSGFNSQHEFVVISHRRYAPAGNQWRVAVPVYDGNETRDFAIAAWVNEPGDPSPLQAVAGELPESYMQRQ